MIGSFASLTNMTLLLQISPFMNKMTMIFPPYLIICLCCHELGIYPLGIKYLQTHFSGQIRKTPRTRTKYCVSEQCTPCAIMHWGHHGREHEVQVSNLGTSLIDFLGATREHAAESVHQPIRSHWPVLCRNKRQRCSWKDKGIVVKLLWSDLNSRQKRKQVE